MRTYSFATWVIGIVTVGILYPKPFLELGPIKGVAMLSSVLHSQRAIQVNIEIIRAFVRLREMLVAHKDLAKKLDALEKKYDQQFRVVFDAIRQMMVQPVPPSKRRIGFGVDAPREAADKK